jgi:hypothetical protein
MCNRMLQFNIVYRRPHGRPLLFDCYLQSISVNKATIALESTLSCISFFMIMSNLTRIVPYLFFTNLCSMIMKIMWNVTNLFCQVATLYVSHTDRWSVASALWSLQPVSGCLLLGPVNKTYLFPFMPLTFTQVTSVQYILELQYKYW